jgi:Pyrimidine dimer DNA glycosylase/Protein of unknown function (DUF1722)
MRIWDINPGYLNDQSLLGEHRELHGIISIIQNNKKGYSHHPETMRWRGHEGTLRLRHSLVRAEMELRGFQDRTPLEMVHPAGLWPTVFIDPPEKQFAMLTEKYRGKQQGRIPLPADVQELWAQHKYSVLARDQQSYTSLGRLAATDMSRTTFNRVAMTLTYLLRVQPPEGGLRNALQHMWGYVADFHGAKNSDNALQTPGKLLAAIQDLAQDHDITYLVRSTALSELRAWL